MPTKKPSKPTPSKKTAPVASSKTSAEKAPARKSIAEKVVNEKPVAARTVAEKSGGDKSAADKMTTEKAAAEKSSREKSAAAKPVEKSEKVDKSEKPAKAASAHEKSAEKPAEKTDKKEKEASAPVVPPKTRLTKDELRQFKSALLELRSKLAHQVGAMEGEALKEGDSEVSVDHMADHGTETFDQDFTLSLIENEENTIREIDAALERINEGTYGMCEPCVEEMEKLCKTCPHILKARLEAIPYTRYCVEYARIAERDREYEESQEEEEE